MEKLKEVKDFTIFKKRSGRYAIQAKDGSWVNGAEKVKLLNEAGFVKGGIPKPKAEEPAAPPEEAAPEKEAPAEEATPAEEAPAE